MSHLLPKPHIAVCVLGLALSGLAGAQRPASGADTKAWLELQKAQPLTEDQVISGERAAQSWERYVESFGREIPETFQRDSVNNAGGGGGRR